MVDNDYSGLYKRIQQRFDITNLSAEQVSEWLIADKNVGPGKIRDGFDRAGKQRYTTTSGISSGGLTRIQQKAQEIAQVGDLYQEALGTIDPQELASIESQASQSQVFKNDLLDTIEIRKQEIKLAEEAAEGI